MCNDFSAITGALNDPFFINRPAKSVLCLPLSSQSELLGAILTHLQEVARLLRYYCLGVVYLQHEQVENAFTEERFELLQLVTTQASVTLDKVCTGVPHLAGS